jgi:hypothetical protein
MLLLVNLLVCAAAGVSMYVIVEKYNRTADPFAYLEPISSGVITALFAVIAAPYLFYRMKGPIGLVYGFGFVLGMTMSASLLTVGASVALRLALGPTPTPYF